MVHSSSGAVAPLGPTEKINACGGWKRRLRLHGAANSVILGRRDLDLSSLTGTPKPFGLSNRGLGVLALSGDLVVDLIQVLVARNEHLWMAPYPVCSGAHARSTREQTQWRDTSETRDQAFQAIAHHQSHTEVPDGEALYGATPREWCRLASPDSLIPNDASAIGCPLLSYRRTISGKVAA